MTERIEALRAAAAGMDWAATYAHGFAPCFHLDEQRQVFCSQSKFWDGHQRQGFGHTFVSFAELVDELLQAGAAL